MYLHISANTKEILQSAIDKVNELIAIDMGSLVEDKGRREKVRFLSVAIGENCARSRPLSVSGRRRKYSSDWSPFVISTCERRLSALL